MNQSEKIQEPARELSTNKPEKGGLRTWIILLLKGIVIGVANVIPGVSGGTIAVITGVFDRLVEALNTLFRKFRENLRFLIPLGIGMAVGIVGLSKVMDFCLTKFNLQTNFFFVGVVLGSMPMIFGKARETGKFRASHLPTCVLAFVLVIGLAVVQTYFIGAKATEAGALPAMSFPVFCLYFFGGMLGAAAMVVPGISGSLVMVLIGLYDKVLAAITGLLNFGDRAGMLASLIAVIPMGLGILLGVFAVAKLIEFLMRKFKSATYYTIFALLIGSLFALLINLKLNTLSVGPLALLASAGTCVLGFLTAFFLGRE